MQLRQLAALLAAQPPRKSAAAAAAKASCAWPQHPRKAIRAVPRYARLSTGGGAVSGTHRDTGSPRGWHGQVYLI